VGDDEDVSAAAASLQRERQWQSSLVEEAA
jgi:hypothetical protein